VCVKESEYMYVSVFEWLCVCVCLVSRSELNLTHLPHLLFFTVHRCVCVCVC